VNALLDRLQAEADRRGETLTQAARHHLLEGVLRRVGRLPDGGGFVLRGGLLTRAWVAPRPRPTRDLDFVGDFPFGVDETVRRFAPVLGDELGDGVHLDAGRFAARGIWLDTSFPGVRLSLGLGLGAADQELSVDVGFGDPLVPDAQWLDYPALLPEFPARVRACRPETQVAWKLHALAEMGAGWRPKDLADLWLITGRVPLRAPDLPPAVTAAFVSRGYPATDAVEVLHRDYWESKTARVRWASSRGSLPGLAEALAGVRAALAPALAALAAGGGES
jgi:hypothetical protein